MSENISLEFLKTRVAELEKSAAAVDGGGGGSHSPGMEARLARLEGSFTVLASTVGILTAVMLGGFAFLGAQFVRLDTKIDTLQRNVEALPGEINAGLRDITKTLAESITAAKQQPPQVILVPAPAIAPSGKP